MLKSVVTVWLLVFSLNASAGHESHGDGTFGAYGYLRVLMEASLELSAQAYPWSPATKKLLSVHDGRCRLRVESNRDSFARVFLLGPNDECLVYVSRVAWFEASTYENRWKGICKVLLENEEAALSERACNDVWSEIADYHTHNF